MIAYLSGKIIHKNPKNVVLNTGNVGYLVNLAAPVAEKLSVGDNIELFIYTRVLEDDISLFGFQDTDQLDFFKLLITVNGVGAKTAMEVMNANIDKVKAAIISKDLAYLTKIPGIGKKTAERILLDLKGKVDIKNIERLHQDLYMDDEKSVNEDAINALHTLGYQKFEIMQVLKKMPETITVAEEIITYFLKNV